MVSVGAFAMTLRWSIPIHRSGRFRRAASDDSRYPFPQPKDHRNRAIERQSLDAAAKHSLNNGSMVSTRSMAFAQLREVLRTELMASCIWGKNVAQTRHHVMVRYVAQKFPCVGQAICHTPQN